MGLLLIGIVAWLVVPLVMDYMGWLQKKELNVYDSYVNLELSRRYRGHK